MKVLFFLLSVLLPLCSFGLVIPNRASSVCQQTSVNTNYTGCYVDLTVMIDMSSAMGTNANIAILTNSILSNLLPQFNFYETYVAGISISGNSATSDYMKSYEDMCNWIDAEQASTTVLGLTKGDLLYAFETYENQLLRTGRNYKKVLVLLTATSDEAQIQAAQSNAANLRADGVYIIVGALGPAAPSSSLYQLGNDNFNSTDYTVPYDMVFSDVCQFGGVTVYGPTDTPATGTTPTSTNPLSNLVGAQCSTNTFNAWLDIVFAIDISNSMDQESLQQLAIQIDGIMKNFTIGQIGDHTTRVAIVTYATEVVIRNELTDIKSYAELTAALRKLPSYASDDKGVNAQLALKTAYAHITSQKSNRVPVIIFTASAYSDQGYDGASLAADGIKADGIALFTVNFAVDGGVFDAVLGSLATTGYSYASNQDSLYANLEFALTQVNCFCHKGKLQFNVYNSLTRNYTTYANCLEGTLNSGLPSVISVFGCDSDGSGVLAAVTSSEKLDFITDHIIPYLNQSKPLKEFIVGGHKVGDQWMWYDFDGSNYPFGSFPQFNYLNAGDQYTFYQKGVGFNFTFRSSGDTARPYVCETKACDADNYCKRI